MSTPRPRPLSEASIGLLARARVLATDVDDTLTTDGKLSRTVLACLCELVESGVEVVLVTGRPAGYLAGLVTVLPGCSRGIAENGGARIERGTVEAALPPDMAAGLAARLEACEEEILARVSGARPTGDRFARISDRTFVRDGLSREAMAELDRIAVAHGFATTESSIHVHVQVPGVDKGRALARLLDRTAGAPAPTEVVTAGDSPTDAGLFDPALFPLSVGVANVQPFLARMSHSPAWVTTRPCGLGFEELAGALLAARGRA
jgi:HAD superfamily hydrolase (TIGR01484 family)